MGFKRHLRWQTPVCYSQYTTKRLQSASLNLSVGYSGIYHPTLTKQTGLRPAISRLTLVQSARHSGAASGGRDRESDLGEYSTKVNRMSNGIGVTVV